MIVDLFAGPGGWDVGAALAGLERPVGLEIDKGACATRAAAGHLTIRADVATYPPEVFAGADGLIASPPCQEFSLANRRRRGVDSDRGALVHEVLRWARAIRPRWIACEQVPPVLPIWRHFAHELRGLGYDASASILCAADFGVPQRRYRAILIARRDAPARWPTATHCATGGMLTRPWVTMAEALNLPSMRGVHPTRDRVLYNTELPAPTVAGHRVPRWGYSRPGGVVLDTRRAHGQRDTPTGSQTVPVDEPAPTVATSVSQWVFRHPATTVMSDNRIRPPGHHDERQPEGTLTLRHDELGILQGFPADYPWQGNATQRAKQIGNAVPPPLAAAILRAVAA